MLAVDNAEVNSLRVCKEDKRFQQPSRRILLLIPSGPESLFTFDDLRTSHTSVGDTAISFRKIFGLRGFTYGLY